jgi:hypothetical protein
MFADADNPAPSRCPSCGAEEQVAVEERARQEAGEQTNRRDLLVSSGLRNIAMGVAWIVGGVGLSLCCTIASLGSGNVWIAGGVIVLGLVQCLAGLIQVVRATT